MYLEDECDQILAARAKKTNMFAITVFDKLEEKSPVSGQYMVEYDGDKLLLDTSSKIYKKKYSEYFAEKLQRRENFCMRNACKFINFSSDMSFAGNLKIL